MTDIKIRLNKFIANAGIAENRKKAESLILSGVIKVNDEIIKNPAHKINPSDKVYFLDKEIDSTPSYYILYNKAVGVSLSIEDENSDYFKYLVAAVQFKEKLFKTPNFVAIYPLLQEDAGLQIVTNDKNILNLKVEKPIHQLLKVELNNSLNNNDLKKINIHLSNINLSTKIFQPEEEQQNLLTVEGLFESHHFIKAAIEENGFKIIKIDRVVIGDFTKWNLPRTKWRHLTEKEILNLRKNIF